MKIRLISVLIILSTTSIQTVAQYPQNYFGSPLGVPLLVRGSFGEIRSNHFHSGIDFSTNEREGMAVLASADGYISRIKVSSGGFGKALYITHPNGYTTVYAHLQKYAPAINDYVTKAQYQRESFEVELYPAANSMIVEKGEVVGISGNTGGSGGPHLHFEIRDSREWIIDPVLCGIAALDRQPPVIKSIELLNINPTTGEVFNRRKLNPTGRSPQYSLPSQTISGHTVLAVETYDPQEQAGSRNGISCLMMNVNGHTVFKSEIRSFSFEVSRYVNAHIDYGEKARSKRKYQNLFVLPNNPLQIYSSIKNNGMIAAEEGTQYQVTIQVADVTGKTAELQFTLTGQGLTPEPPARKGNCADAKQAYHNKDFTYQSETLVVDIPASALYYDEVLCIGQGVENPKFASPVFAIHYTHTALQKNFEVHIKTNPLPAQYESKALLVYIDDIGRVESEGGKYEGGFVRGRANRFGNFAVAIDTVAPTVRAAGSDKSDKIKVKDKLVIHIADNLSGIDTYRATLDDKWLLMEYDAKTGRLIADLSDHPAENSNQLKVTVTDQTGNTITKGWTLIR